MRAETRLSSSDSTAPLRNVRARPSAFTLIEVLVVVAIIALLVSVLIPSLRRARDQAKLVACRSNLHDSGIGLQQYANGNRGYYPLASYIGTRIYESNPGADDNLLTLWLSKVTRNVATYTCPATHHAIRAPERIEKVPVPGKGIRYDIYTAGEPRNDFEFHGQVIREQMKTGGYVETHLNGTSYEYDGWSDSGNGVRTTITWLPFMTWESDYKGFPRTQNNIKSPWKDECMRDADEGESNGGDVVGAPPGGATNNIPEPWDNHGKKVSNQSFWDGHVISYPLSYWQAKAKKKNLVGY